MTTTQPIAPPVTLPGPEAVLLPFHGPISAGGVECLRQSLQRVPLAPRVLRIDCSTVTGVDPVGAALFWLLCAETERSLGTRVELLDLPEDVRHMLRLHPLLEYRAGDESLFQDPFDAGVVSAR